MLRQVLYSRSVRMVETLERGQRAILMGWVVLAGLAYCLKVALSSQGLPNTAEVIRALPFMLVIGAPAVSLLLALRWFRNGHLMSQPTFRLSRVGKWRNVSAKEARQAPLYGVSGIFASLLLGLLVNVPFRTLEFLGAIPVLGTAPPSWLSTLQLWMLADTVLLSSLYVIAFAAALRKVPLFPRLMVLVWMADAMMQTVIAVRVGADPSLPADVGNALATVLTNNLHRVGISAALWLPYLALSRRVNITFRHRV